jgi:hypothetical protein
MGSNQNLIFIEYMNFKPSNLIKFMTTVVFCSCIFVIPSIILLLLIGFAFNINYSVHLQWTFIGVLSLVAGGFVSFVNFIASNKKEEPRYDPRYDINFLQWMYDHVPSTELNQKLSIYEEHKEKLRIINSLESDLSIANQHSKKLENENQKVVNNANRKITEANKYREYPWRSY